MPPNREYWWSTKQPQVTDLRWQLGFQWHQRGIELVFKSLDCFTKPLFHTATFFAATYVFVVWNFTRLITRVVFFFFFFFLTSIWWGSTQLQCICYLRRILISRPRRVFRRFKRRSCFSYFGALEVYGKSNFGILLMLQGNIIMIKSGLEKWEHLASKILLPLVTWLLDLFTPDSWRVKTYHSPFSQWYI